VSVYQLVREVDVMELDPLDVYQALGGSYSYILQSAEGGEKVARYSFIGVNPIMHLKMARGKVSCRNFDRNLNSIKITARKPLEALREVMSQFDFKGSRRLRFVGGLVGYLAYDIARHYNPMHLSKKTNNNQPDGEFILARNNIIYDHAEGKTYVTENYFNREEEGQHEERLIRMAEQLMDVEMKPEPTVKANRKIAVSSNLTKRRFEAIVEKAKDYIRAGDVFQVVLSQRLAIKHAGSPLAVYRTLKKVNPSPYMYYLNFKSRKIAGSSPEMLARVEDRNVVTYPIAGTRSRGKTVREDRKLEDEMLADAKERAEHVMLVDLGRNDIGRVAEAGSVKVKKFMHVEKYSHVQHLISEVSGTLKKDLDCFDALKSIFPAGTVSGAPKVRAMEIIDELEPDKRGVYAGCIGYFSFNKNMDTAIAIRTIVFENNNAYIQAGAGIVADSIPAYEYKETLKKARALVTAIQSN